MKLTLAALVALLLAPPRPAPQVWLLDDFESPEHVAAHELAWIALGDDLMGGASTLALENVRGGAKGSGHALRLQGSVGPAPSAFTGAWAPLDGQGRPVDLAAFDTLRFLSRGKGTFQAGLRSGSPGTGAANFMASFTPGPDWQAVEIPFDRLAPVGPVSPSTSGTSAVSWQPQEVHWLGITTSPGEHGPFLLEVDDVELISHGGSREPRPAPIAHSGPPRTIRVLPAALPAGIEWRELAEDPVGDGKRPSLPDAVSVAVMAGDGGDRLWFRIGLHDAPPVPWLGVNLAFDVDGDPANGIPWWGANTAFRLDRLVTVWLFKTGSSYQGVAGTSEAKALAQGEFMADGHDVSVTIDRDGRAILVGVPRSFVGQGQAVRFLAAVGSALGHNDDVPNSGAILLARPGREKASPSTSSPSSSY